MCKYCHCGWAETFFEPSVAFAPPWPSRGPTTFRLRDPNPTLVAEQMVIGTGDWLILQPFAVYLE